MAFSRLYQLKVSPMVNERGRGWRKSIDPWTYLFLVLEDELIPGILSGPRSLAAPQDLKKLRH